MPFQEILTRTDFRKKMHIHVETLDDALETLGLDLRTVRGKYTDATILLPDEQEQVANYLHIKDPSDRDLFLRNGYVLSNQLPELFNTSFGAKSRYLTELYPYWRDQFWGISIGKMQTRPRLLPPEVFNNIKRWRGLNHEKEQLGVWTRMKNGGRNFYNGPPILKSVIPHYRYSLKVNLRDNSTATMIEAKYLIEDEGQEIKDLIRKSCEKVELGLEALKVDANRDLFNLAGRNTVVADEILDNGILNYLILANLRIVYRTSAMNKTNDFNRSFKFIQDKMAEFSNEYYGDVRRFGNLISARGE